MHFCSFDYSDSVVLVEFVSVEFVSVEFESVEFVSVEFETEPPLSSSSSSLPKMVPSAPKRVNKSVKACTQLPLEMSLIKLVKLEINTPTGLLSEKPSMILTVPSSAPMPPPPKIPPPDPRIPLPPSLSELSTSSLEVSLLSLILYT